MSKFLTEEERTHRNEYRALREKVQWLREKVEPIKHECRMTRLQLEADKLTHFLELHAPEKLSEPINVHRVNDRRYCSCKRLAGFSHPNTLTHYCAECAKILLPDVQSWLIPLKDGYPISARADEKKPLEVAPAE